MSNEVPCLPMAQAYEGTVENRTIPLKLFKVEWHIYASVN